MTREIDNLAANMLTRVASPTLLRFLADRKAEKARLEQRLSAQATSRPAATIIPNLELRGLFREKVARVRETLDDATVCGGAAAVLSTLIESVTIHPEGPDSSEAEVVAKALICWRSLQTTTPPRGAAYVVLWCWLRGQDLNL